MLAARLHELGGRLRLEQVDEPVPGDGQALVELAAASINPVDVATTEGRHYSGGPELPSIAGSEGVGRLLGQLATGTSGQLATGTLVYAGRVASGTLAERFLARAGETWALPDDADPLLAVALGIAGMAGWLPIAERAALQPGERVLVLGATGSVGRVAVQAALLLGASLVVGAGRDAAGLAELRSLGARTVGLDGAGDDLAGALREPFGDRGPDVVLDPLYGAPLRAALEVAAPGARIVQMGQSAGAEARLASATIRGKQLSILGYSNRAIPLDVKRRAHLAMLDHATAGRLHLPLTRYPLSAADEAFEAVRRTVREKVVVTP